MLTPADITQGRSFESGEVHIWQICQPNIYQTSSGPEIFLDPNEQKRATRFKSSQHGAWWSYVHGAMRDILSQYANTSAHKIKFSHDKHGKPFIASGESSKIFFNLSHSGKQAIVAISKQCQLGIDIEMIVELKDIGNIVQRFFSASEQKQFALLCDEQQKSAFYRIWTQKEAVIKANGLGLNIPLDSFDVPIDACSYWTRPTLREPFESKDHYYLKQIQLSKYYQICLCLYSSEKPLQLLPNLIVYNYCV